MSKIQSVTFEKSQSAIEGDALLNERFNPKSGVRLTVGQVYYFPDSEDFNEGRGFYKDQPDGFDDSFYGIILLNNGIGKPIPLGTLYRDRVSIDGKIKGFNGQMSTIVRSEGFICDIVRNGIGGTLKDLSKAILKSGFIGFKVVESLEVMVRKYGTDNDKTPREVYRFVGVEKPKTDD